MRELALPAMVAPLEGPASVKAGDLAAFEQVIRQHERMVLVTALRLLGNLHDAQDASQEVFLKLYRNLGKMGTATNFSGWIYRVTVNVCHDLRKKRPASVPVEDAARMAAGGADPQQETVEAERRRVLQLSL